MCVGAERERKGREEQKEGNIDRGDVYVWLWIGREGRDQGREIGKYRLWECVCLAVKR